MMDGKKRRSMRAIAAMLLLALLTACGGQGAAQQSEKPSEANKQEQEPGTELKKVKVVLDWAPNTNHTGLYVARDKGFFAEQGLDVEITAPPETGADQLVASGKAEFGVSYQESITNARIEGVPLVSIAAVIQHNTSGFAAPVDREISSPADFEGKRYGGWGSPVEEAVIASLMLEQGKDVSKVSFVNSDLGFFNAVKQNIDFAWIFYAWTGIEAELRNEEISMLYVKDYDNSLDYYTPVLATSEKMIAEKPELVKAFVAGASAGYMYASEHPAEAADILLAAEPDLNAELVKASQEWLRGRYQDDAPRWGEQKLSVWQNYATWLYERDLLSGELDAEKAFTNEFLPQ